jgi:cytochrome c553
MLESYQYGEALYRQSCAQCHNDADSTAPWLDGQHANYLVKQLKDFREGQRSNDQSAQMRKAAATLSDTDIQMLSLFLSRADFRNGNPQ